MPTYVYRFVKSGETIEVQQAFTDDSLTEYPHPKSGKALAVKKVFQPVGVTFKGSGFFKTDNRGSQATTPPGTSSDSSSASSSSDSASSSKDSGSSSKDSGSSSSKDSGSKKDSSSSTSSSKETKKSTTKKASSSSSTSS